jgi:transcriptional regulator with XRE-family HTH domain
MESKMTRTNLKILMETKGISMTEVANALRVSPITIYEVMRGQTTSKRIESALEISFGMPITEIRTAWNNKGKPVMTPEIKKAFESLGVKAAV